jgi:NAD(P)-dependent dehydrogenase (short-subunit alcohol dehydrogenase family)
VVSFDKVAIVTGGSKGIGAGCARALCAAGGKVVICDIDVDRGKQVAAELTADGPGECHFEPCDVRVPAQIQRVIDVTIGRYGRLDCLVNNAGYHPPSHPIDRVSIDDLKDLLQLNLVSVFAGCKFALPHLRQTHGSIVNIGSLVAIMGQELATMYCTTKGAVSALTKALAIDEARYGVRVNAVLPGNILTPLAHSLLAKTEDPQAQYHHLESLQWLGRWGTVDEVGQACLFLASGAASYITGVELILSGGSELGYGVKAGPKPMSGGSR